MGIQEFLHVGGGGANLNATFYQNCIKRKKKRLCTKDPHPYKSVFAVNPSLPPPASPPPKKKF